MFSGIFESMGILALEVALEPHQERISAAFQGCFHWWYITFSFLFDNFAHSLFQSGCVHLHACEVGGYTWPLRTRPVLLLELVTVSLVLLATWKNLPGVK